MSSQQAVYVGPLGTYSGFKLSSTSPVGLLSAGDGLDSGARISSSTTASPAPTPTPTPTPTNTAAAAVWKVPTSAVVGAPVTLDGTASRGDGPIACTWSLEDQAGSTVYETVTGCKVSKTFPTAGTKYVKLTVKDADGQTNSLKQSFNVSAVADTPATAVWSAPVGAKVGVAVTLDGSASKGDAQIACTWSFEDQAGGVVYETLTGCKLSKAFKFVGTKYVKLTVKDADGDTNLLKRSFTVS